MHDQAGSDDELVSLERGPSPADAPALALRPEQSGERERLGALIQLLADESPAVWAGVRDELVRGDGRARVALERAARSSNALVRGRARRCLSERERVRVLRRIASYGVRPDLDLERALFLLGRLDLPRLDRRPYVRALDSMGAEVKQRAARELDPLARAMVLPQFLGNELGFIGSEADFTHPDNIHLHRAIERKRGMPLTLTAIYLFVARRAGIRAAPVALPGRVILRVYALRRSVLLDPFHGGRVKTRADLVRYLAEHGLVARTEWFRDVSDASLFQRHVLNLMASSQTRGLGREARELHRLAGAIGRARGGATRR